MKTASLQDPTGLTLAMNAVPQLLLTEGLTAAALSVSTGKMHRQKFPILWGNEAETAFGVDFKRS